MNYCLFANSDVSYRVNWKNDNYVLEFITAFVVALISPNIFSNDIPKSLVPFEKTLSAELLTIIYLSYGTESIIF